MRAHVSASIFVAIALAASLAFGISATTNAQDKAKGSAFDQIRALAGDWAGTMSHGEKNAKEATVSYRVTSGGSAVVETLGAGTDHEMVTVYHKDGEGLMLTHYCMIGNQPRMRAESAGEGKKLEFKFAGGANIKSDRDAHMHDLTIEFLGADHIRSSWSFYKDGKAVETAVFDMKRKKK
jgi:hypothetical protein